MDQPPCHSRSWRGIRIGGVEWQSSTIQRLRLKSMLIRSSPVVRSCGTQFLSNAVRLKKAGRTQGDIPVEVSSGERNIRVVMPARDLLTKHREGHPPVGVEVRRHVFIAAERHVGDGRPPVIPSLWRGGPPLSAAKTRSVLIPFRVLQLRRSRDSGYFFQSLTPGPSLGFPMNSTPASSKV